VRRIIFIFSALLFLSTFSLAQDIKVRGQFLEDSVKIGQQVPFSLTASYPRNQDILFPDSSFSFAPFEFIQKKFFTTITKDSVSYDSVVYYISTFDVTDLQKLRLPVFVVQPRDCTMVYSLEDSLKLIRTVKDFPDSLSIDKLPVKLTVAYQKVSWTLNYPLIILIVGTLLLIIITLWIAFGTQIRKRIILRRLQRNHATFINKFNAMAEQLKSGKSSSQTEEIVIVWKKYMEGLVAKPFTKYTSKEIIALEKDQTLGDALRSIDRLIYGGFTDFTDASFAALRTYTEDQYHKKTEEVKNG
jgi:hypothetical protein